ncbi:MAG: glycosyltransferase family 2 protein [Patescibacteria group bacterium]
MSKLSIIIVTYNSENLIGSCLDSIFKTAGGLELEVIIIDNNSQDDAVNVVKTRFPQARLIENKENVGFARAVNQGIKMSQGEFVLLLNPDMRVLDKAIKSSLEFLETNPKVGILGAQLLYPKTLKVQPSFGRFPSVFTEFLQAFGLHKILPWGRFIPKNIFSFWKFKKICRVDWLGGGFMMVKKEVFDKVGLLDEKFFMYLEDIDFCYRAKQVGFEVYYFPKAKVIHHHMASAKKDLSKPIIYEAKSLIYYFKKYSKNVGFLKFLIWLRLGIRILGYFSLSLFNRQYKDIFSAYSKAKKELINL